MTKAEFPKKRISLVNRNTQNCSCPPVAAIPSPSSTTINQFRSTWTIWTGLIANHLFHPFYILPFNKSGYFSGLPQTNNNQQQQKKIHKEPSNAPDCTCTIFPWFYSRSGYYTHVSSNLSIYQKSAKKKTLRTKFRMVESVRIPRLQNVPSQMDMCFSGFLILLTSEFYMFLLLVLCRWKGITLHIISFQQTNGNSQGYLRTDRYVPK